MTEDEYWQSDPEFEDDGFSDTFLSDETEDINMIIVPKIDYDLHEMLESYVKGLKRCKTTDEALGLLHELTEQIKILTIIEVEYGELQEKAHQLEVLMDHINIR